MNDERFATPFPGIATVEADEADLWEQAEPVVPDEDAYPHAGSLDRE